MWALHQMQPMNKPNVKDISEITGGHYTYTGYWVVLWSYLVYYYTVGCNDIVVMLKKKSPNLLEL